MMMFDDDDDDDDDDDVLYNQAPYTSIRIFWIRKLFFTDSKISTSTRRVFKSNLAVCTYLDSVSHVS